MSAEAVLAAARLMWPAPASVLVEGPGAVGTTGPGRRLEFLLVPSAANPRLVVPAGPPAASARVASSATAPGSVRAGARTAALALGLRSGAAARMLRDRLVVDLPEGAAALDAHLGDVVGRQVLVGFRVGPPRANRKPVLQLVTPHGELVGYAKLGVNALTDMLVAAESAALTRLGHADLGEVRIPALLHSGTWQGHPLVVQSALPVRRGGRGRAAAERTTRAMISVASAGGLSRRVVAELPWWQRTAEVVAALPDTDAGHRLAEVGRSLHAYAEHVVMTAGSWHGDWNPGNCAVLADEVLVWDWERFESGVPVGFDALHLSLHGAIGAGVDPLAAAGRLISDAPALLAPFEVGPDARLHPLTSSSLPSA